MEANANNTLENIINAAKSEFLEKGYRGASLRNIVKSAKVTTGAFYGYFKSKEELFDALVCKQADFMMTRYLKAHQDFVELSPEEQKDNMAVISGQCMDEMLDYMYTFPTEIKLLLTCSEGTKYENFIHDLAEVEIEATHRFNNVLHSLGVPSRLVNPQLEHMLVSGMFAAYFEMILHDIPIEQAHEYLKDLRSFHTAGWQKLMGF